MHLIPLLTAVAFLAFAATPGVAAEQPSSNSQAPDTAARQQPLSNSDKKFLSYAAEDNQAEIQLCLLAEKKAADPALKAFARLMVDDHVAVESRLAALANDERYELPNGIGDEGKQTTSKLEPLSGQQFDKQFLDAQIEDHGHDIEKFSTQEKQTDNQGSKRFASETLPILRQHLALAKAVQAQMKQRD